MSISGEICTDNRFEIIAAYKKKLIEETNIHTRPEEMAVIDNILFRFWQMGWLPPIPHGRLIDADALAKLEVIPSDNWVFRAIEKAPTIIPADQIADTDFWGEEYAEAKGLTEEDET